MSWIVYENEPFEASAQDEKLLRRVFGGDLESDGHRLRVVRVAGHVRLPDGRVLVVRSRKAGTTGLLAWLAFGDPALEALRLLGPVPSSLGEADFGSLVARMFAIETWRAIQTSGLMRTYQRQHVRSPVIRGRIDFAGIVRSGGDLARTPCIVFARLPHTPLNCLLAAAATAIQRDRVLRRAAGSELPALAALLAEIPPIVDRDLLLGKRALSRLEQPFATSAALARLVIRCAGLAAGEAWAGPGFLLNLADLFEKSVVRAFRESNVACSAKHPVRVYRRGATAEVVDSGASMELDVFLPSVRGQPIVVDAKYKQRISAANLQQAAAYCWLTGARRAALVVPGGQVHDRRSFVLPGAASSTERIQIDVVELDLGADTLSGWREAARRMVATIAA